MTRVTILLLCSSMLAGCATYAPSIPKDYTGPRATIKDSATVHSTSKVDYYVVTKVDGKTIANSRVESMAANYGRGFYMEPVYLDREIPARSVTVEIVARTEYAAPILALTNAVYEVKGSVTFTPEEGKVYVVKGDLGETYSAVWIEDASSGALIGNKVEKNGSAKLGFFQK